LKPSPTAWSRITSSLLHAPQFQQNNRPRTNLHLVGSQHLLDGQSLPLLQWSQASPQDENSAPPLLHKIEVLMRGGTSPTAPHMPAHMNCSQRIHHFHPPPPRSRGKVQRRWTSSGHEERACVLSERRERRHACHMPGV
jgi:hypothetical protein